MNVVPEQTKVEAGGSYAKAEVHDRTSLFVSIAALFVSGIVAGLLVAMCILIPELIEAKIQAGAARSEALAELARKEASTAKDMVDLDRAKAKAREELKNGKR